ncbi:unknown [Helicoverpa armigera nucleopolyhedrovirus]|uniref:ORF105 n=3 Tax=Alphabaculovirus helarmigerae TaxID=3047947 RepID=Q99GU7_9ABAC|nr:hypothetical protein HanGV4gp102 [Helicoverpa armigera nucleopolyhedrovirus G4]NP_203658.1 hypothetical protein [Helicoverpa armigera nucleopolyhedrovirus]AAL56111.1 ORF105 [Helicoverpa zea single nucleopolyhedrovirus]AEN04025.1 hypothetical protein [Helicoverpa armigera NPV strain Australia]AIG63283.1 ORF102 [Helicoverpa armigera SNPV]AXR98088.1 hypothetical protein [Helicoverpa assulta nucleopolyhedrovirus]AAG53845.1 unknown [Helicoverpa armigera nucleopolyhedrovirus G4]
MEKHQMDLYKALMQHKTKMTSLKQLSLEALAEQHIRHRLQIPKHTVNVCVNDETTVSVLCYPNSQTKHGLLIRKPVKDLFFDNDHDCVQCIIPSCVNNDVCNNIVLNHWQ